MPEVVYVGAPGDFHVRKNVAVVNRRRLIHGFTNGRAIVTAPTIVIDTPIQVGYVPYRRLSAAPRPPEHEDNGVLSYRVWKRYCDQWQHPGSKNNAGGVILISISLYHKNSSSARKAAKFCPSQKLMQACKVPLCSERARRLLHDSILCSGAYSIRRRSRLAMSSVRCRFLPLRDR